MTIAVPGENTHTGLEHGFEIEGGGEFLVWSAGDYEILMSAKPIQGKEMARRVDRSCNVAGKELLAVSHS